MVRFAQFALQTSLDLGTHTNAVANLDGSYFVSDFDSLANDLMTDADGKRAVSPTTSNGVDVRTTNTTTLDLNVYVTILEWLGLELH